ncbi:hypothetical protein pb186bvf_017379 [Paramecium bursaria]
MLDYLKRIFDIISQIYKIQYIQSIYFCIPNNLSQKNIIINLDEHDNLFEDQIYIYFPFKVEQQQLHGDCFNFNWTRALFLEVTCLARAKSVTQFHSEAPDPIGMVTSSFGPRSWNCLKALYSKVFRILFSLFQGALKYGEADFHLRPTEYPARFKNESRQSFLNKLQVLVYLQTSNHRRSLQLDERNSVGQLIIDQPTILGTDRVDQFLLCHEYRPYRMIGQFLKEGLTMAEASQAIIQLKKE